MSRDDSGRIYDFFDKLPRQKSKSETKFDELQLREGDDL